MICTYKKMERRDPPREFRPGEYITGTDGKTYCVRKIENGVVYVRLLFYDKVFPLPSHILPR